MKLYEISNEIQSVLDNVENIEHLPENVAQELDNLQIEFDLKVENLVLWMKGLQADVEVLEQEEERLQSRRLSLQRSIEWAKNYINAHTGDQYKLKTPLLSVYKINTTSVAISDNFDWASAPPDFYHVVETVKPNKKYIKQKLEETGLPIKIAENPLLCVVMGAGKVLSNIEFYKDALMI